MQLHGWKQEREILYNQIQADVISGADVVSICHLPRRSAQVSDDSSF